MEEEEGGPVSCVVNLAVEAVPQLVPPRQRGSALSRVKTQKGRMGEGGRKGEDEIGGEVLGEG